MRAWNALMTQLDNYANADKFNTRYVFVYFPVIIATSEDWMIFVFLLSSDCMNSSIMMYFACFIDGYKIVRYASFDDARKFQCNPDSLQCNFHHWTFLLRNSHIVFKYILIMFNRLFIIINLLLCHKMLEKDELSSQQ